MKYKHFLVPCCRPTQVHVCENGHRYVLLGKSPGLLAPWLPPLPEIKNIYGQDGNSLWIGTK